MEINCALWICRRKRSDGKMENKVLTALGLEL